MAQKNPPILRTDAPGELDSARRYERDAAAPAHLQATGASPTPCPPPPKAGNDAARLISPGATGAAKARQEDSSARSMGLCAKAGVSRRQKCSLIVHNNFIIRSQLKP